MIDLSSKYVQLWLVAPPFAFLVLCGLFRILKLWDDVKLGKGTRGSDFLSFLLIAGSCVNYLGFAGLVCYYGLFGVNCIGDLQRSHADPWFYGRSEFIENHLIIPMFSYQIWNTVYTFICADIFTWEMVGHHAVTTALAYFAMHPYLQYYAIFYFGLFELSNVPLTIVEFFDRFKFLAKKYHYFNEFIRVFFAFCFILFRLIIWPIVSKDFWVGSVNLLLSGKGHSSFVIAFFLLANAFLTILQFYFGSLILGHAMQMGKQHDVKHKEPVAPELDSCCCSVTGNKMKNK